MNETRSRSERYNNIKDKGSRKKRRLAGWVKIVLLLISIVTIILLYGHFIGTKGLEIKEYKVKDSNLTDNFYGFKIIHLSDIHYGRTIKDEELKNIVDQVNSLKPDIVVITGDLFDKNIELDDAELDNLTKELKRIDSGIKKYIITGNHDEKIEDWNLVIKESDFTDLNDNYDLIYKNGDKPILISGISTSSKQGNIDHKLDKTNEYLASLKDDDIKPIYSILLMHEPDFINDIDTNKFNLVLAGHSHNGQVNIPLIKNIVLPKYAREYYDAHYQLDNTNLYISSGLGTSTINVRLFCRPSFNIYRLTNK